MTERAANVIEALARVIADMPGIGKTDDSSQGYKYRGIEAITREAQELLGKHGVVFVPRVVRRDVKDLTINNKPWTQDEAEVVYTVYGPGGIDDRIEIGPLWGLGRDNSDKGMNKAMTQAFKYALLQALCIGDAKDDGDSATHEADADEVTCSRCGEVIQGARSSKEPMRAHLVEAHGWARQDDGTVIAPKADEPSEAEIVGRGDQPTATETPADTPGDPGRPFTETDPSWPQAETPSADALAMAARAARRARAEQERDAS